MEVSVKNNSFTEGMMKNQNPNCDGTRCTDPNSEVRVLPYGGGGNLIVCKACYEHEIKFRKERIAAGVQFELPTWKSLEVYSHG